MALKSIMHAPTTATSRPPSCLIRCNCSQSARLARCGQVAGKMALLAGPCSLGQQQRVHHLQPCRASSGEEPVVNTDPLSGRAEVFDAREAPRASTGKEAVNVWDSKPPWCQPWTIVLTGATIDALAWRASGGSLLVSGLVAFPVFVWWWLFLGVMPAQYAENVEQVAAQGQQRGP